MTHLTIFTLSPQTPTIHRTSHPDVNIPPHTAKFLTPPTATPAYGSNRSGLYIHPGCDGQNTFIVAFTRSRRTVPNYFTHGIRSEADRWQTSGWSQHTLVQTDTWFRKAHRSFPILYLCYWSNKRSFSSCEN